MSWEKWNEEHKGSGTRPQNLIGKSSGFKKPSLSPESSPSVAKRSVAVGDTVRVGDSFHIVEPLDSEDTFPPAIASYGMVDGYLMYQGRNGSEGVIAGSPKEVQRWTEEVRTNLQSSPAHSGSQRDWDLSDGGEANIRSALDSAEKTAKLFGIPTPHVQFTVSDRPTEGGSYGTDKVTVVNAHKDEVPDSLNFKPHQGVTEGAHTAAHEVAHAAYSSDPESGQRAMEALRQSKKVVSVYHSLAGHHEGLMDLAAAYSHSPSELKAYSPALHKIAGDWVESVRRGGTQ